jgi:simple sugar transport system permease protein
MPFSWEKRLTPSKFMILAVPCIALLLSLVFCGVFLLLTGRDPIEIYTAMLSGALGSFYGLSETVVKAIPLMLCGLGISVAFRMQLWNIGAEGQLYVGALAATWLPLTFPSLPALVMLPLMVCLGMAAGALWAFVPAILRARWQVNEIITTLMLNYVGILWVSYLVYGPWRDPKGLNFPLTAQFPDAALLPFFGSSRIHIGLLFALAIVVFLYILFNNSRWGYELKVIGSSPKAARYAGMNITQNICLAMLLSGAICGLAGMTEVSGIIGRLQPGLSPGYGYTGIIIAWLGQLNPFAIVLMSLLFGALQVGGYMVQTLGVPAAVASIIQGSILFFVIGAEILTRYQISYTGWKRGRSVHE